MGQSKGNGYDQVPTLLPEQLTQLMQSLGLGTDYMKQAAAGYQQFLPGGGGGEAIKAQAMKDFEQKTLPSIHNSFGVGNKGSSALNQALAQGGANLNTDLAAKLAEYQLQASQGLGNMGQANAQMGLQTPAFAYQQQQQPMWLQAVNAALGPLGQVGGAYIGRPRG